MDTNQSDGAALAEIEPLYVFIDTSTFEKLNYDFRGRALAATVGQVKAGRIVILSTSVTDREVGRHIEARLRSAVSKHGKFRSSAYALRPYRSALFPELDPGRLVSEGLLSYARFKEEAGVVVVPTNEVNPETVLGRYFSASPPFGEAGKKHEFPDAFALLALEGWLAQRQLQGLVVAEDGDLVRFAEQSEVLQHVGSVDAVLSRIEEADEAIAALVEAVRSREDVLTDLVSGQFSEMGFILVDQDGDVEDVAVEGVEIEDVWVVRAGEGTADIVVQALVQYAASVRYKDFDTASYDSEDKVYFVHQHINATVEGETSVPVHMTVTYVDPANFSVEDAEVEGQDVQVHAIPEDEWC